MFWTVVNPFLSARKCWHSKASLFALRMRKIYILLGSNTTFCLFPLFSLYFIYRNTVPVISKLVHFYGNLSSFVSVLALGLLVISVNCVGVGCAAAAVASDFSFYD
jgi:hypothetical protein